MLLVNDSFWTAVATSSAVVGTCVLVLLLAIEYFAPRWPARAALLATLSLAACSAIAMIWLRSTELALALGVVACGSGLTCAAHTKLVQYGVQLLTRPVSVTASLLLACLAIVVYVRVAGNLVSSDFDLPLLVGAHYHSIDGLVAVTDRGRVLPLIAYDPGEDLLKAERDYLETAKFKHQVVRLRDPDTACNCHGWVYTGGRFAVQSRYIDELLADNGYTQCDQPQIDDLVIYRGLQGTVEHTGLVRMVGRDGLVLVESKWGPLGVYIHPVDAQPYGTTRDYFRSRRAGHLVSMVPAASVPTQTLPELAGLPSREMSDIDASASVRRVKPSEARVLEWPISTILGQHDG